MIWYITEAIDSLIAETFLGKDFPHKEGEIIGKFGKKSQ